MYGGEAWKGFGFGGEWGDGMGMVMVWGAQNLTTSPHPGLTLRVVIIIVASGHDRYDTVYKYTMPLTINTILVQATW